MEPPARRTRLSRRVFAADRPSLAPLPSCAGLLSVLLLSASCGGQLERAGHAGSQGPDLAFTDATGVAPGDEGTFDDLPGVEAFEGLAPELQEVVVDRANRTRCDCGCPRHSVNHCLHQEEACEIALRLARSFVDDALSLQLQAGGAAPAAPEDQPDREPVEPDGPEKPAR